MSSEAVNAFQSNDPHALANLLTSARDQASQFLARFRTSGHYMVDDALRASWNEWVNTVEGEAAMALAVSGVTEFMHSLDLHGCPGHDRRHLLKDALAGLRFCLEDGLEKSNTLFLIAALMHDAGRLVEPKLAQHGNEYKNEDHCAVGFWATNSVLDKVAMPISLRDHLLYAVLQHQGRNDPDSEKFFLYATQRGDREQIPGPEGISRQLASDLTQAIYRRLTLVGNKKEHWRDQLPAPYSKDGHSWFHHLEFYLRNLHPSVGNHANERADDLKVVTGRFLLIAAPERQVEEIFAPEYARDNGREFAVGKFKTPLSGELWARITADPPRSIVERMNELKGCPIEELLDMAVHPTFAARTDNLRADGNQSGSVWDVLKAKVEELEPSDSERFKHGLTYLLAMRESEDRGDLSILRDVGREYSSNSVPSLIANFILGEYDNAGLLSSYSDFIR